MKAIHKRLPTQILECRCPHDQQDAMYGKWRRVFNFAPAQNKQPRRMRCTVCGRERDI